MQSLQRKNAKSLKLLIKKYVTSHALRIAYWSLREKYMQNVDDELFKCSI